MTLIGKTSNTLFFNGVADGIVVPQSGFERTGLKLDNGARSSGTTTGQVNGFSRTYKRDVSQVLESFSIEAWVAPDHGGVVVVKEDLFELRIGAVGEPGPVSFNVHVSDEGTKKTFGAVSATPEIVAGTQVGWDGIVYPRDNASFMQSGNCLNEDARELLHIVGSFDGRLVKVYVNGELVSSTKLNKRHDLRMNENDLYIGSDFRGHIESVHWRRGTNEQVRPLPLTASTDSIGLWRFEEPVEVDQTDFHIQANVVEGATTINIGTAAAQTLYESITGLTDFSGTLNVATDYGLGNYQVSTPTGKQNIAHTSYNLLINPTLCDTKTGQANLSPPERVRLLSVATNGDLTVNSIHLDFDTAPSGARGVLHARTAFDTTNNLANDSLVVLVKGDLLVDSGTGAPYRPPGIATQMIDRTGQMVIDESGGLNHGIVFSRKLSIGQTKNPFDAAAWPTAHNDRFKEGHTARHKYSQRIGHPFLRVFPDAQEEIVTKTVDGAADHFSVHFDGQSIGMKDQVPINSQVSLHRRAFIGKVLATKTDSTVTEIVENGHSFAATSAERNREIIAIGGANFDVRPFLLKGHAAESVLNTDNVYDLHLAPETESRIAILEVPTLAPAAPYVQIHYNAIDLTGSKMGAGGPVLLVEKTVPSGGSVIGGQSVAAHIAAAVGSGMTLHAPGGMLRVSEKEAGDSNDSLKPHRLVGDNTGGRQLEIELDESLLPVNHTPVRSTDLGNLPPQGVDASHSLNPVHPSVYNKIVMRSANRGLPDPPVDVAPTYFRQSPRIDNDNTSGAFDVAANNHSSHVHEVFDVIDNYRDRGEHVFIVQPSSRSRVMQLVKAEGMSDASDDANHISLEFLQVRGRVSSVDIATDALGRRLIFDCRGLMDDVNVNADFTGDGSPDSHPIKEIMPGAPVVTVTLGGPGQGAVNTKPTFDPSPLSRLGWSTRRDCNASVNVISLPPNPTSISVSPLNNNSTALASWGTYCFPEVGRVYLASGASAAYSSKTATTFSFDGTIQTGTGVFLNADGSESEDYAKWVSTNNIVTGTQFLVDNLFNDGALCADGTTVNDRLFQSLRSVNHDYQLGTQYASTRALAEIPLFPYHFFEDRDNGVFPGPDNSLKLTLDATMTAHSWSPNPVGRRCDDFAPADREVMGAYHFTWINDKHRKSTKINRPFDPSNYRIYVEDSQVFPDSSYSASSTGEVREMDNSLRKRRAYLANGEWCWYRNDPVADGYLQIDILGGIDNATSKNFLKHATTGTHISPAGEYSNDALSIIGDDGYTTSTKREFRRPYYHDRANVQTQGGNVDYGLRQYVSAIEFKAGPRENPHLPRIKTGGQRFSIVSNQGGNIYYVNDPDAISFSAMHEFGATYAYTLVNESNGGIYGMEVATSAPSLGQATEVTIVAHPVLDAGAPTPLNNNDEMVVRSIDSVSTSVFPQRIEGGLCNATWNNPYAPGGLRSGDTVWMNMHYTNPHAIEGIFAKSRGVFNEFEVWAGFNEGRSNVEYQARDSIALENFLIGDDCLTTARNYAQHVNKTIELNWASLGRTDTAPVIAYVDPYLSTQEHARVLLYDVAHDREAVSFQDLWMQVQSGQKEMRVKDLDVANGFKSQRRDRDSSYPVTVTSQTDAFPPPGNDLMNLNIGKSEFMESAYSHRSWYLADTPATDSFNAAFVKERQAPNYLTINDGTQCLTSGSIDRTDNSVCCPEAADDRHARSLLKSSIDHGGIATEAQKVWNDDSDAYPFQSTFFDTPDGTRAIPAFLALKGKRSAALDLTNHTESRLQHLPHWSQMDFVRRLKLDLGEVGVKEGVTDIEAAAREVVRLINQAGALNGRSSQRRPADQYPGESERFDITKQGTNRTANSPDSEQLSDPTAPHHRADFAVTGSTHDPAAFWDDTAFSSFDRGSHMGYMRAHIGRVVEDVDGVEGFTLVIHSTVPGATGRNFAVWLDNSRAQAPYRPQFLVGHGGRFRNFWCQPDELLGENMHPAPMPINKQGRPFAPITTLREYLPPEETGDEFSSNNHLGYADEFNGEPVSGGTSLTDAGTLNDEVPSGRSSNTNNNESFESQQENRTLIEGLRVGTRARARINFGGLVASGVPGWSPDAGRWGFGVEGHDSERFANIYGLTAGASSYNAYVPLNEKDDTIGDRPIYGMRFVDHLGRRHTIRFLYRQYGKQFANDNTKLPSSIENEIVVWMDDRDVAQGGFTLGNRVWGNGDPVGRTTSGFTGSTQAWKGNLFSGLHVPEGAYAATLDFAGITDTVLPLANGAALGYHTDGIWHDTPDGVDVLGHLGFPDSGMIWLTHSVGATVDTIGHVFHYTHRTHNTRGGQHSFYGITGEPLTALFTANTEVGPATINDPKAPVIISPVLNQTTLVTDELLAAVVEHAMSIDPNSDKVAETTFDCRDLYAPDGRTFGEWGVSESAVRVQAYSDKHEVIPLRDLFEVDRQPDWGLYAGSLNSAVAASTSGVGAFENTHLGGLTRAEVDVNKRLDTGYVPRTLLHITTKYRGTNANTATPVLIDSHDNVVDLTTWKKNLRGEKFTRYAGDHVTPSVENAVFEVEDGFVTRVSNEWFLSLRPQPVGGNPGMSLFWLNPVGRFGTDPPIIGVADFGGATDLSYAPLTRVWFNDRVSFEGEPKAGKDTAGGYFQHIFVTDDRTAIFDKPPSGTTTTTDLMTEIMPGLVGTSPASIVTLAKWGETDRSILFDGARLSGSPYGQPFTYFRGARDSPDHSVPLYFGGGFSGVVLDINDGTQNDYSSFYTHPYSSGPTGTAGIQHANEIMGSHCILDTAAMLAMFPGTGMLDQHKGEVSPPFANQDMTLSPDMDGQANNSKDPSTGLDAQPYGSVDVTRPSPLLLRFAHPHGRYTDTPQTDPPQTTYVVFGPGQAFPKHWASEASETGVEPSVKWSVASATKAYHYDPASAAYFFMSTRTAAYHPNEISHGNSTVWGLLTRAGTEQYLPPVRAFTAQNAGAFKAFVNWETAHGFPNINYNQASVGNTLYSSDHFGGAANLASVGYAHPFADYGGILTNGVPIHPDEILGNMVWHMDGGYPAGGHFFDNCVRLNPVHPVTGNTVAPLQILPISNTKIGDNATIYRGCAQLIIDYDPNLSLNSDDNVIIIDATRVQNAEELGAVIAGSINTYPGSAALKALGGTFAPSFGSSSQQDRYSWLEMDFGQYVTHPFLETAQGFVQVSYIPDSVPAYGWIRVTDDAPLPGMTDRGFYGYYYGVHIDHAAGNYAFLLDNNRKSNLPYLEDPTVAGVASGLTVLPPPGGTYKVYCWTKTGNVRWSNGAQENLNPLYGNHLATRTDTIFDHLAATQVHFNGAVNAVDRTRPVGGVGWGGERYSYLNSLLVTNPDTSTGVAAGKSAWHAALGFTPYGVSNACHSKSGALVTVEGGPDNSVQYTPVPTDCPHGVHPRHYVVVSHESELPLVAKFDRNGVSCTGDLIAFRWGDGGVGTAEQIGTTLWDAEIHNADRYTAPAHGGPNVEALWVNGQAPPDTTTENLPWNDPVDDPGDLLLMESCLFPTGDLFFDTDINPGAHFYADTEISGMSGKTLNRTCAGITDVTDADTNPFTFWQSLSAAWNFTTQHVVWKRMDGGNLSLPASNARGLGAVPFITRVKSGVAIQTGEKVLGNNRFTFETTNAAMYPIIQAQELAHPQVAELFPFEVRNVLEIPNEELQFERMTVVDDTGQTHVIEGGSPFGTIIRDFELVSDRDVEGLAPSEAGSGNAPNMKIRLPDPDTIPGNIIVRSGFDRAQAYQNESIGTGGMQRSGDAEDLVKRSFDNTNEGPRVWPTWENNAWDHIDSDPDNFPDNSPDGWRNATNDAPLRSAYEQHDRSLYFHVTQVGYSASEREPVKYHTHDFAGSTVDVDVTSNPLTFASSSTTTLTVNEVIDERVWTPAAEQSSGRWFLSVNGVIASYTGVSGSQFTGVVFAPGFSATANDSVKPSFFVPAGSNRFFAARRMRDHSELSGESPDMPLSKWHQVKGALPIGIKSPHEILTENTLTPVPLPRMGHHFVTPTMAMLPGHFAHPLYQRLYTNHYACSTAAHSAMEKSIAGLTGAALTAALASLPVRDPVLWFSGLTANYAPSDIHGGAFTLLTETKIRYDGYGILASDGTAGTQNSKGSHLVYLEASKDYTLTPHFPDPMEVGAYQIVIQPNVYAQQLVGFHQNTDAVSDLPPFDPATSLFNTVVPFLTGQQVATVIGIDDDNGQTNGAIGLILAEAIGADVRGCEIYLNETMLDIDPAPGQQFATLPPLATFNPLGVNESSSPAFTRRSLPYHPGMFRRATPGYTLTVPWWANTLNDPFGLVNPSPWKGVEHYHPDQYYHFCRSTLGAIGSQITLAGYPTHFYDAYTGDYSALSPVCSVISVDSGNSRVVVDNNDLFPLVGADYYGAQLELVSRDGRKLFAVYTNRGYTSGGGVGLGTENTSRFEGVVPQDAAFWTEAIAGARIRLTSNFHNYDAGEVYTDSRKSVATRNLPQLLHGTRDTNSLHLADAFLVKWHPNLGRPYTFHSDSSRPNADSPAFLEQPLNHLPEFFEMVHYHEFTYAISNGPLGLRMKTTSSMPGTGSPVAPEALDPTTPAEGGIDGRVYHLSNFWPGGSRYGAQASRLDHWGDVYRGWGEQNLQMDDCKVWINGDSHGTTVSQADVASEYSGSDATYAYHRQFCFGHRFAVRQPYNRPRWAIQVAKGIGGSFDFPHGGYEHGPLVQHDDGDWTYEGEDGLADFTLGPTNAGIIEQQTNASALLGADVRGHQVRYSDGRRMTRPFGCPVRNIVNPTTAKRLHPGDVFVGVNSIMSTDKRNLAPANMFYVVDWWGNTTGEDVRKFPVRGFGIRPSWDPEDAYALPSSDPYTNNLYRDRSHFTLPSLAEGTDNRTNRGVGSEDYVDWFNPASAMRVGDRGDGRGCRWSTAFNENVLQDVSIPIRPIGMVLSHHTAEPPFTTGLLRPTNDAISSTDLPVGISRRLGINNEEGLLKPEAMSGLNVEQAETDFLSGGAFIQEAIARISPRIGLDGMTVGEATGDADRSYVVQGTHALSLHTDRSVGQRYTVAIDYDLTSLDFSTDTDDVMKLSLTDGINPLGGNYILDLGNYMEPVSDANWGRAGKVAGEITSNPYQTDDHDPFTGRTNNTDKQLRLLLRPVRVLDHRYVSVFRHARRVAVASPQDEKNYFSATAGGRYGVFVYDAPGARVEDYLLTAAPSPTNPPYAPVYFVDPAVSLTAPVSVGPFIPGAQSAGFSLSLRQTVARLIVSANTLQHYRSDAPRRQATLTEDDDVVVRPDYSVQPRHSQTTHPGTKFNTGDHSGEVSDDYSEVNN